MEHFRDIAQQGKEYKTKDGKSLHQHTLNAMQKFLGSQAKGEMEEAYNARRASR